MVLRRCKHRDLAFRSRWGRDSWISAAVKYAMLRVLRVCNILICVYIYIPIIFQSFLVLSPVMYGYVPMFDTRIPIVGQIFVRKSWKSTIYRHVFSLTPPFRDDFPILSHKFSWWTEQPNCRQLPAPIAPVGRLQVYSEDCEAGRLGVPKDSEPKL